MTFDQYRAYSKELEEVVLKNENIVIITHMNPDGDAIGSVMGMYHYLRSVGKDSQVIVPNRFPTFLDFLDRDGVIGVYNTNPHKYDSIIDNAGLIIALDFNTPKRIEWIEDSFNRSRAFKFLIDHHPHPEVDKFDQVVSETEISSTCELIFQVIMASERVNRCIDCLSNRCALSLWTGIITDTNNFSNSLYSSTLEAASFLIKKGIDVELVRKHLFGEYSESRMRLMGKMLYQNMKIDHKLKAGYIIISQQELKQFSYKSGDTEGFVNLPLSIKGVDFSALFFENDGYVKVSFRSRGDFLSNEFSARYFNGGGHDLAAGGRLYMPIEEVEEYFLISLTKYKEEKIKAQLL